MDTEKLKKIIESHGMWLRDEANGKRANLGGADLYQTKWHRALVTLQETILLLLGLL